MARFLKQFGDNLPALFTTLFLIVVMTMKPVHAMPTFFDEEDRQRMRLATENTISEPTTAKVCVQNIDDTEAGWCPTVDSRDAIKQALEEQLKDAE